MFVFDNQGKEIDFGKDTWERINYVEEMNKILGFEFLDITLTIHISARANKTWQPTYDMVSKQYVDNLISNVSSGSFVTGMILMWSGSIDAVPTGWALCNGQNGTPNLMDRFIVGAGSTYSVGTTGGSATVTLTTAQMPSHTHTGSTNTTGAHTHSIEPSWVYHYGSGAYSYPGDSEYHTSPASTKSAGDHSHTLTINAAGSGNAHENRPPYYALAYIMKL